MLRNESVGAVVAPNRTRTYQPPWLTTPPAASASAEASQEISVPVAQRIARGSTRAPTAARTMPCPISVTPITVSRFSCRGIVPNPRMSSYVAPYVPNRPQKRHTATPPTEPATNTARQVGQNPGCPSDRCGSMLSRSAGSGTG
jgi:hypothetical protein